RVEELAQPVDDALGNDHEQGRVDGVHALAEDGPLPAALAAGRLALLVAELAQEGASVLKVVARPDPAEGLSWGQGRAVAGVDVADLALRNRDQRRPVDAVLPAPQPEVEAAAQQVGLEAGFATQGDDPAFAHRPGSGPELLDHADLLVGDVAR